LIGEYEYDALGRRASKIYRKPSVKHYFALHNSNWNVVALRKSANRVVERYEYDPCGNVENIGEDYEGFRTVRRGGLRTHRAGRFVTITPP